MIIELADVDALELPEVNAAIEAANCAIEAWTVNTGDEQVKYNLTSGYSGTSLVGEIARQILMAQGYDVDHLIEHGELRKVSIECDQ